MLGYFISYCSLILNIIYILYIYCTYMYHMYIKYALRIGILNLHNTYSWTQTQYLNLGITNLLVLCFECFLIMQKSRRKRQLDTLERNNWIYQKISQKQPDVTYYNLTQKWVTYRDTAYLKILTNKNPDFILKVFSL